MHFQREADKNSPNDYSCSSSEQHLLDLFLCSSKQLDGLTSRYCFDFFSPGHMSEKGSHNAGIAVFG